MLANPLRCFLELDPACQTYRISLEDVSEGVTIEIVL